MAVGEHHAPQGFIRKFVFSTDHKVIGVQYLATALVMAFVGIGLSVMIRMQLASDPDNPLVSPETYISLVTMHGTIMVFFVVSLALVSGLGNILIPLMLGARDMAYPFLNMLSYWTIVPACLLMLASFLVEGGAAAGGLDGLSAAQRVARMRCPDPGWARPCGSCRWPCSSPRSRWVG